MRFRRLLGFGAGPPAPGGSSERRRSFPRTKWPRLSILGATLLLAGPAARAEIVLAPLFGDHGIVQCDKPLPVWGRAAAGEKLAVNFRGETVRTTAGADGRWIVYLKPIAASAEPADLTIEGKDTLVVHDVLVGELWLASGQSNMEFTVSRAREDQRKLAAVDLPLVRHLKIERAVSAAPVDTAKTSGWKIAAPDTVGDFTAVGYFFAREVQRRLGVPVGIINSSWGGTPIEAWMSDAARAATSLDARIDERWRQAMSEWTPERIARYPAEMAAWQQAQEQAKSAKTKNPVPWPPPPATGDSPMQPGSLFNAMIAPLQPAAIRGILWYQGESNAGRAGEYAELFPAMIRSWRSNWGEERLPFLFVQLPNFAADDPNGRQWARLREAQARALELPATGMAVAIDLGDPGDIHPTDKLEVGRRLALIAKTIVYEMPGDFSGPVLSGVTPEGAKLRVRFTHAGTGLVAHDRPVQSLEIAGADKVFYVANGTIDRGTLVVSSPKVKAPLAVRYAWSNAPEANLYNGAGLPAAPFRSDDW